jgi:periplasmic divalent cation tolerance protein
MDYRALYITTADAGEARRIGRALVEERLVACVNIMDAIHSLYWWEGSVQEDGEAAMIAKTRADLVERAIARIRELHSYECPCIVAYPLVAGNPDFLRWIADNTLSD